MKVPYTKAGSEDHVSRPHEGFVLDPDPDSEPDPTLAALQRLSSKVLSGAAILVVGALSLFAAGFEREASPLRSVHASEDHVDVAAGALHWKVLRFGAVAPAEVRWSDPRPAHVKIDEARASRVGAPLAGRVTQVFVELGEPVKRGDALFSIASPDLAGLRSARARAAIDLEVAGATLQRVKAMVGAQAMARKDEIEADLQLRQAQIALRLTQSKLASLSVSARADNEFTVVAPRDGVVVAKNVLPAQQVSAEADLVEIADLAQVWVVAELFEADAIGVVAGTLAKISSPSLPDLALEARVDMVASIVDPRSHTVSVRVRLDNAERRLKPNLFAEVRFAMTPPAGSGEVAASSLFSDGARQYVYVQAPRGHFARRAVMAGAAHEGKVPILAGLEPGEIVVEEGAALLDNRVVLPTEGLDEEG